MMDKDRKMRCEICIKEIVFGYVNPDKDYTLCKACAFRDDEYSTYYGEMHKNNKENKQ